MEVTTPPRRGRAEKLDCQNKLNNNLFKSPERGEREAMLKVMPRNTRHDHQPEHPSSLQGECKLCSSELKAAYTLPRELMDQHGLNLSQQNGKDRLA